MHDDMSPEEETGKIPLSYKVMMVAVVVITALAVWLLPDDRWSPDAPPLPDLPGMQADDTGAAQVSGGTDEIIREGDRARAFIAGIRDSDETPDTETVFIEAERLQSNGHTIDAHLLYRYAARHGHGEAAMLLGTQADPAFNKANNPAALKNKPEQAYKWYSIAFAQGVEEAGIRLQVLRKRTEKSAEAGDEHAQRLLLLWK